MRRYFGLLIIVLGALAIAASCGSSGSSGPSVTVLVWQTSPGVPTAGNVSSGQTNLYKFTFPNDGSGDPSAQIAVSSGSVDAYLCASAACGPGYPSVAETLSIIASGQVFTTTPNVVADYYVAVHGNADSSYTIKAIGT